MGKQKKVMGCFPSIPEGAPIFRSLTDLEDTVETGDVILFSGHGPASSFLRFASLENKWSHTGVVVVTNTPHGPVKWIAESNLPLPLKDEISKTKQKDGPQLVRLRRRIETYDGFFVAVRRIVPRTKDETVEKKRRESILAFLEEVSHAIYERDPIKFVGAAYRRNVDNSNAFYCTEFAAEALWRMGILDKAPSRQFENFTLDDFCWGLNAVEGLKFKNPEFLQLR